MPHAHKVHTLPPKVARSDPPDQIDWRLQLFNSQQCGPVTQVSMPAEAITSLHGILFDIDPSLFRAEVVPDEVRLAPAKLYKTVVAPWLEHHPALKDAEVIDSGRGLHIIPRFVEPVVFESDAERQRWSGIVKAVQAALPTDPDAPGITALTRPVGSTNSKTGTKVKRLKAGKPIATNVLLALFDDLRDKPFSTVMGVLRGSTRVSPCPICAKDSTSLKGLDRIGICYGGCGKVKLSRLYDVYLAPRATNSKSGGVGNGQK